MKKEVFVGEEDMVIHTVMHVNSRIENAFVVSKCISCQVCCHMCAFDSHRYDPETEQVFTDSTKCVGCHFCESFCPTNALIIRDNPSNSRGNANWQQETLIGITKQAETGYFFF